MFRNRWRKVGGVVWGGDLNEKTLAVDNGRDASSPVRKAVAYESDVSEGVQVTVLFQ